jgi:RNA polymerase sigma factor (sigma-70 family)
MNPTTQYTDEERAEYLLNKYDNFIQKYMNLFTIEVIDFNNYSIRSFLALHIADKSVRKKLRRGKLNPEIKEQAVKVMKYLAFKLRHHSRTELYHELAIPFIYCVRSYKDIGVGFKRYLYKTFKFALKKHLDKIKLDGIDTHKVLYIDGLTEEQWSEEEEEYELVENIDGKLELNNPEWIHGDLSSPPFDTLKPHERYILAKYYYEEYKDREIARMLPYHPKAIHRIRMRMKKHFQELYDKGEMKWLRL